MYRAVQVRYRFLMDSNDIGAGLGERIDIEIGILDHQVYIERLVSDFTQGIDHQRADGDVWDEMTVHDINVNVIGAGAVNGLNIFTKTGKIGGKDRWGDFDHMQLPKD